MKCKYPTNSTHRNRTHSRRDTLNVGHRSGIVTVALVLERRVGRRLGNGPTAVLRHRNVTGRPEGDHPVPFPAPTVHGPAAGAALSRRRLRVPVATAATEQKLICLVGVQRLVVPLPVLEMLVVVLVGLARIHDHRLAVLAIGQHFHEAIIIITVVVSARRGPTARHQPSIVVHVSAAVCELGTKYYWIVLIEV